MKKTLSLALVAVLGLGVTASTFAFFPGGSQDGNSKGEGKGMGMGRPMMMFGMEDEMKGEGNRRGHKGKKGEQNSLLGAEVKKAIVNKDYNAFVKARNEGQSKITAPTAEEFAQRVTMTKARQAIDDAITAGNYEAFKTAITKLPKPINATGSIARTPSIPTQDEFNKMVAQKKARESMKTALKNNDYNAFLTAWNNKKPNIPTKEEFTKITEIANNVSKKLQNGIKKVKRALRNTAQN